MADLKKDTDLSSLTVLQAAELAKMLEEKWGVSAAAAVAVAAHAPTAPIEAQTEFTVVLVSGGDKKINVIKEIRAITGLGLKEAKDLVEAGNKVVKDGVSKDDAAKMRKQLEDQGAKVAYVGETYEVPRRSPASSTGGRTNVEPSSGRPSVHQMPSSGPKSDNASSDVGSRMRITGDVWTDDDVTISGCVTGDVTSPNVLVANSGVVEGCIFAENAVVRGVVHGGIRAERILLQSGSRVGGDVFHQSLAIEQGAYLEGKSYRVSNEHDAVSMGQLITEALALVVRRSRVSNVVRYDIVENGSFTAAFVELLGFLLPPAQSLEKQILQVQNLKDALVSVVQDAGTAKHGISFRVTPNQDSISLFIPPLRETSPAAGRPRVISIDRF